MEPEMDHEDGLVMLAVKGIRVLSKGTRVERCRQIVREHAASIVDDLLVDAQTANAVVIVYDALKPSNQEKFSTMSMARMAEVAWKLVK